MSDPINPPLATTLSIDGLETLNWSRDGLLPAVVQDRHTREVLMVGHVNREMLQKTLETGDAWFWSRSRHQPWHKGETSGNYIRVREVRRDCEDNSVLFLADPVGPVCHTGATGCFFRELDGTPAEIRSREGEVGTLDWLWHVLEARRAERPDGSYVVKLLDQGVDRIAKKVGEEAAEVIIAAKNRSREELSAEMADLWFHSLLILLDAGMQLTDIYQTLASRHRPREAAPTE